MATTRPAWRHLTFDTWHLALTLVFLAALSLRLFGLNWDQGGDLHPDELFVAKIVLIDRIHLDWPPDISQLLDPARSGLNPRSADPATGQYREFAYGALPLWVTDFAAWVLSRITGTNWNAAERVYLFGRVFSAVLSSVTVLVTAMIGRRLGGRSLGLLAALFAAFAPMSIQLAHFFTTDSWLTCFVALCLLACCRAAERGTVAAFALAGCTYGLAMATKGSVVALGAPIAAVWLMRLVELPGEAWWGRVRVLLPHAIVAAIASLIAFFAFEPYALLRPMVYVQSLRTQADIVSGRFDVPFTRVFSGTVPGIYQVEQVVRWGLGPVAGLLALGGLVWLAHEVWQRRMVAIILASWLVAYCAVLATAEVKFLRYLEPLTPVFAICAGGALLWLVSRVQVRWSPRWATALLAASLALSFLWTAAFTSIYARENPRVAATKWIYAEIPPGSNLTAEYWDDALPRSLTYALNPAAYGFGTITFDLYRDLPPPDAVNAIGDILARADYVIQSSLRVEAGVRAEPWRYPAQIRYYDALADGELGFLPVAQFASWPGIGPLEFDDRAADESFINYDHPLATIYQKDGPFDRAAFDAAMSWAENQPWQPSRWQIDPTLLLSTPVGENPSVNDGRWSAAITSSTPGAIVAWVVLLAALVAAGLPWARLAFVAFPDQGWGLARILGLVLPAYLVWILASLELVRFRAAWCLLALGGVAGLGWWLVRRSSRLRPLQRADVLHPELAFWAVFTIFLAFRFAVPDGWHPFWGGEKPMEFALINAIERSAYFPPYDPWFADGYVNYYYYGFYLVAFLFKLIGIPGEVGFNLALPTMMGLLAAASFTMAGALAQAISGSRRMRLTAGWFAVLAMCLIGNLSALRTLLEGTPASFDGFITWTWDGSRAVDFAITEFPYFSGLYADLHSHVIALPITVTIIAVSYALAQPPDGDRPELGFQRALLLILAALLLGTLFVTNAWDVPVYAALAVVSLLMGALSTQRTLADVLKAVAQVVAVVGGAYVLFLPFHRHFVALFSQVALVHDPTDLLQFLTHFGAFIAVGSVGLTALLLPEGTKAERIAWPVSAIALALAGVVVLAQATGPGLAGVGRALILAGLAAPPVAAALWRAMHWEPATWRSRIAALAALAGAGAGVVALVAGRPVLGLMLALVGAAGSGWISLPAVAERFACLLLTAAFGVAGGVEVVVVADDLINTDWYRMNTVFKFYNQVWVLLAMSCAVLVALMAARTFATPSELENDEAAPVSVLSGAWSRAGVALAVVLCVFALTYPALATLPRLEQRMTPGAPVGSLNALAWMDVGSVSVIGSPEFSEIRFAGDRAAIDWLQQNVPNSAVIAEASIGPYRCNGSRIANATGLPTIIGWERHQQQQRFPELLPARVSDVRTLYTSADVAEKEAILRKYNVEYVVVGDLERIYPIPNNECTPGGSEAGIAAFDQMVGSTLEEVFSQDGTTIYRVLPAVV
jgi:uncharacterized membrane protein/4-amino-4-deoxy-L-arabinose transferase-like glycosyltransferase